MRLALDEARRAADAGDVPVGAVVLDGTDLRGVLAVGQNRREIDADPTAHAEIVALRAAARQRGTWRLDGVTLLVTKEPCAMCAGAIVNARVARLVYGCDDVKAGAVRSLYRVCDDFRLNHRAEVIGGVLAAESAALLRTFFEVRR